MEWVRIADQVEDLIRQLQSDKPTLLRVRDKRICIVMRTGTLYAVEDKCPHNGESLSKGTVNYLGEVICPWHGYRYDLKTGRESAERCRDLVVYPIDMKSDGVYLGV